MRARYALFALLLVNAPCLADENYCGELPASALTFEFVSSSATRTALDISVPLRDGKAKFHRLDVAIGNGDDQVSFSVRTEVVDGRAEGVIRLPRPHKNVRVEAIYHQGGCFKLLKATFEAEKRLPSNPPDSGN